MRLALDVAEPVCPAASRAVTRIRPCVVAGPGADHVQLCAVPARPVQPATAANVVPPSAEKATSIDVTPTLSVAVHRIA